MTIEQLTTAAAFALSILMHFWPAYDGQPAHRKALIMAGLLLGVTGGAFALSCFAAAAHFTCSEVGAWDAVLLFAQAVGVNQGAYLLTRDPVAELKARRAKQA